jgi:outer membrane protein TolC
MKFRIAAILLALTSAAHAEGRKLTLAGAIDLALTKNPDIAVAAENRSAASSRESSFRAKRWFSIGVNAALNEYTEPFALDFAGMPFVIHAQGTTVTNVVLSQPLTGFAYLSELVGAASHDTAAAGAEYDRARLDAAYSTADAYVRALEAHASAEVSARLVSDIDADLKRAETLRAADTLTNVDVLRLQSAKAAAEQTSVRSDTSQTSSLAKLAVTIGLHDGDVVEITDDLPAQPPALAMTLDAAIDRAISARPELRVARERIAASQNISTSKWEQYVPAINAIAAWQHTTGLEPFQPANEEYIGLQVQWKVWDWGSIRDEYKEAVAHENAAKVSAVSLADHVRLEVRTRWLEAQAGFKNVATAQTQLESAEEAYRLQKVKYENGVATTTDVLDAESDVARARLQSALARYDYYLALIGLARSVGDIPSVGH